MRPPIEEWTNEWVEAGNLTWDAFYRIRNYALALEKEKAELVRLLLPFREAIKRARSHKLGEAWMASYLDNNAWLRLEQAMKADIEQALKEEP